MTKEIIIDGVNVAECKHFWNKQEATKLELCRVNFANNYFSNGIPVAEKCKKHPDCYFKQLQRLKKENTELLNIANNGGALLIAEKDKTNKYKQALEEIREIINEQKPTLDKAISQSEFTLERLCNYEEKYIKIVDKINEVLNEN